MITPITSATSSVTMIATIGLTPCVISVADIIALIPTTAPMERSMLLVIITKLCPTPIKRYFDIERSRFCTFCPENTVLLIRPNAM